ncbi:MAG: hypothetical protein Q9175_004300, partial [Cornicularia normoerica]
AQRIPISLLELNTFGHAICALLIYLLWWEKPFEVDYPTMNKSQILWDFRARFWMEHSRSSVVESFDRDLRAHLKGQQWFQALSAREKRDSVRYPKVEIDLVESSHSYKTSEEYDSGQANANHETHSEQETAHDGDNEAGLISLAPGQIVPGTGWKLKDDYVKGYNESHPPLPNISLTTQDVTRWKMAERVLQYRWTFFLVSSRCEDWPDMDAFLKLPVVLGFSAAALIYGGLHALAWFAHFDSSLEQLLWRISACVVMGGVPVFFVLFNLFEQFGIGLFEEGLYGSWYLATSPLFGLVFFILSVYVLARAYLVVECFINLSNLPAGAYDVPTWSAYVPHIA